MKVKLLILSLSFSCLILVSCKDGLILSDIKACSYSPVSKKIYCGKYSMSKLKFVSELKKGNENDLTLALIIPREEWLTKLKPEIKRAYRAEKDRKKRSYVETKEKREIRNSFNLLK